MANLNKVSSEERITEIIWNGGLNLLCFATGTQYFSFSNNFHVVVKDGGRDPLELMVFRRTKGSNKFELISDEKEPIKLQTDDLPALLLLVKNLPFKLTEEQAKTEFQNAWIVFRPKRCLRRGKRKIE